MNPQPPFPEEDLEALARLLGDCGSRSEISRVLEELGLEDDSGETTKWRRLNRIFLDSQRKHGRSNQILDFVRTLLTPALFAGQHRVFEMWRRRLNDILASSGLVYGTRGEFHRFKAAKALDDAATRVRTIQAKFRDRRIHEEVMRYCTEELLQDDYFHAVFEATRGLAQRIRDLSGVDLDGEALVEAAFAVERPILAFNTLRTETERSSHKGFATLLKGCFAAVRNPLAHEPKFLWDGEDDAADYLSLISLLHSKLDDCVRADRGGTR